MTTMIITLEEAGLADEVKELLSKLKGVLSVSVSEENASPYDAESVEK